MPKFTVIKSLELRFECEAASAQEAEDLCISSDDQSDAFSVVDCQYHITRQEHPDTGLNAAALQLKYPIVLGTNGHPEFQLHLWTEEVTTGCTVLGYYDWVEKKIDESNKDED